MVLFPGNRHSYYAVAAADILCFVVGTASTWSSPVLPTLQSNDVSSSPLETAITQDEASWIGSLSSMGGIFSPLIWGFVTPYIGRKTAAIVVIVPFLIAYLTASFATIVPLFYFARVLMGIGMGGMFCVLPIYIVEIAEDVNRGLFSASTGCFLVAGMLFSNSVGPYVSIMVFNLILSAICVLYVSLFCYLAPETPYYFIRRNQNEKALESLRYLRRKSSQQLQIELDNIKSYLSSMTEGSFLDIFRTKGSRKAFIYSVFLTTFQQFSGINVIFAYMENIFGSTGTDIPPEICSIIVAAVQVVFSVISPSLSDKVGRRTLMLFSITGATVAEAVLGVYFYLQDNEGDISNLGWLPVVSLVVFMMFYNSGMGSLPWAIMSEILPADIISKSYLIVTSIYWFVGWLLAQYFADLIKAVGNAGSFWLFAGFCVLHDIFVFVFIFETKGKSLQEIKDILEK